MIGVVIGAGSFLCLVGIVIGVIYVITKPTAPQSQQSPPSRETPATGSGQGTRANNLLMLSLGQKITSYAIAVVIIVGIILGLVWLGRPKATVMPSKPPIATTYKHADKVVADGGPWQKTEEVDWTKVNPILIPKDCQGYYLYNPGDRPFLICLPDGSVFESNDLNTNSPKRYLPLLPGKELKLASLTGKSMEITFYWN